MYLLAEVGSYRYTGPQDVYVTKLALAKSGLAAIASDQSLRLFDPRDLGQGPLKTLRTDHGNISALEVFDDNSSIVSTCGENGSISIWDLRLDGAAAQVAQLAGCHAPVISLACSSSINAIASGTEFADHQASVLVWDVRSVSSPRIQYNEVHSDDVTELNFHPADPTILLSGSTDGLVNVCDTKIADEDEVVIQTFNHGSVHRAGFLNNTEIFALSHDEKFALYDVAEEQEKGSAILDLGDIRPVVNCQYVADVRVKPGDNGAGATIGAGTQDQQTFTLIHMWKDPSWRLIDLDDNVGLPGAHGSEIVRSFCVDDWNQSIYTAGEDGQIKAWRAPT